MVKVDGEAITKYLAFGAGAVAVPSIIMGTGFSSTLANIPMWNQAIWGAITIGGIVLASVGIGLMDQLFFNK